MKKPILAAILALGATLTLTSFAGQYISNWGTISRVSSYGDGIRVNGLTLSPNPCSNSDEARVDPSLPSATREGLTRTLLSAFLAKREVKVKLQSTACAQDRPLIYGVWVR